MMPDPTVHPSEDTICSNFKSDTPDYTSISFQGWREDGVLNLPDVLPETTSTSSGYRLRRPRQISSDSHILQTKKLRTVRSFKHRGRLVLPRAYWISAVSDQLNAPLSLREKRDWFSWCNLGVPHIRSDHTTNEMSRSINTTLSQNFKNLHIGVPNFTLFPNLPSELRLKIWSFALPRERLVDVVFEREDIQWELGSYRVWKLRSTTDVPAMLHVCFESRAETTKNYSLMFGQRHSVDPSGYAKAYFDPSVDILFINCHRFPELRFSQLLSLFDKDCIKVKHMADVVNICFCTCLVRNLLEELTYPPVKEMLREGLPSLKRLICVSHSNGSLSQSKLVPSPEWAPAILEPAEIASLEGIWALKPELMIAKSESWDWSCECVKVESRG